MENWTKTFLERIASLYAGGTPATSNPNYWGGEIRWMSSGEVNLKRVFEVKGRITELGFKNSSARIVPPHSILIALAGQGKTRGTVAINKVELTTNQSLAAVVPKSKNIDSEFLFYNLDNRYDELRQLSVGGGRGGLNLEILKNIKINLPPLGEQRKIAEILSTWDKAIETTEKLVAAKQKLKKSLMQRLLTGAQRFPEFRGQEWKSKRLGEVASESIKRNGRAMTAEKLMAVMKSSGIIPMRERVQSENVSRCKIVAPNWFAYNPMRLNIGSIAQWKGSENVMVSGDYIVFKCDESILDSNYFNHFRRSYKWTNFVKSSGDGSVRIRIYFSHLSDLKILLPPLEEQKKIARVLNVCDAETNVLQNKLAALRRQKRGLMQKLLTGRVRVKVDEN